MEMPSWFMKKMTMLESHPDFLTTRNAGGRVACAVIGMEQLDNTYFCFSFFCENSLKFKFVSLNV